MGPGLIIVNKLLGCQIPNSTVRPLLVVFPAPRFNDQLRFLQRHKPMFIETFIAKLAVEALDKRILHRFPRLNEVQVHAVLDGPGIQGGPGEFWPVVYAEARLSVLHLSSRMQ